MPNEPSDQPSKKSNNIPSRPPYTNHETMARFVEEFGGSEFVLTFDELKSPTTTRQKHSSTLTVPPISMGPPQTYNLPIIPSLPPPPTAICDTCKSSKTINVVAAEQKLTSLPRIAISAEKAGLARYKKDADQVLTSEFETPLSYVSYK